ncbi:hypothetical protein [Candidatus Spyradosoma sp. SGI.093]|uniref:hypothetical protein n=1 Tax=Candidatus Spyradosoma sp. SGI.093 TaxID=3420583 RepID=UPI003CFDDD9E
MTKTKKILSAISICAAALALGACASQKARYVDSAGTETIVSLNKVDIQDFRAATNALVADMLQWDAFAGAKKPVVALSRVVNDTSANFDTALLTNQVQEAILKSRKATISMSMSADRNDDVVRQDVAALGGTKTVVPDLTLIGKISEVATNAGGVKQVTYVFQMRLVEAASGNVVWMNSKEITKQGEKNAVGW